MVLTRWKKTEQSAGSYYFGHPEMPVMTGFTLCRELRVDDV
jgi:hypothetical protein